MKLSRTRTSLELRVGSNASVRVLLHVRQTDLEWFNANAKEHTEDLWKLMEDSVLPRLMHGEIEDSHHTFQGTTKPPPLGRRGIEISASYSRTDMAGHQQNVKAPNKKGAKRKRVTSKAKRWAAALLDEAEGNKKEKARKNAYYAFGKALKLVYKCEEVPQSQSASFVFRPPDSTRTNDGILQQLDKLSQQIVAWCFPYDPSHPTEADPTDGGFPRPERIPIAYLFREGVGEDAAASVDA
jgi:hypothetical protein